MRPAMNVCVPLGPVQHPAGCVSLSWYNSSSYYALVLLMQQRQPNASRWAAGLFGFSSASRFSGTFLAGGLTLGDRLSRDLDAGLFGELS